MNQRKTLYALTSILTLLLSALANSPAAADTLYVNNISGSNLNNGAMAENRGDGIGPLKSITAALKMAKRGDHIELADTGTAYKECITLQGSNHSGSSFAPFILDGNGATLDGSAPVPSQDWEHMRGDVFRFVPERTAYQQVFVEDAQARQLPKLRGASFAEYLQPLQWCLCDGAIQFAAEKGKSVHNYNLSYAKHSVGITLYDVENVVIHDLKIRGFQLDGINAHDNAMDCILSSVTCTENGRSGVTVDGASRVRIVRSKLHKNGAIQLNLNGWSTTNLHQSKLAADQVPVWKRHVNRYGRGARLFIDEELQYETQGWSEEEEQEEDFVEPGAKAEEAINIELEVPDAENTPTPAEANVDQPDASDDLFLTDDPTNDLGGVFTDEEVVADETTPDESPAFEESPVFEDEPASEESPVFEDEPASEDDTASEDAGDDLFEDVEDSDEFMDDDDPFDNDPFADDI